MPQFQRYQANNYNDDDDDNDEQQSTSQGQAPDDDDEDDEQPVSRAQQQQGSYDHDDDDDGDQTQVQGQNGGEEDEEDQTDQRGNDEEENDDNNQSGGVGQQGEDDDDSPPPSPPPEDPPDTDDDDEGDRPAKKSPTVNVNFNINLDLDSSALHEGGTIFSKKLLAQLFSGPGEHDPHEKEVGVHDVEHEHVDTSDNGEWTIVELKTVDATGATIYLKAKLDSGADDNFMSFDIYEVTGKNSLPNRGTNMLLKADTFQALTSPPMKDQRAHHHLPQAAAKIPLLSVW